MKVRIGVLNVFVALVVFSGVVEAQSYSADPGVSVAIRAFNSQVSLGSGVTIAIRVTNVSTTPITFLFGRYGNVAVGFDYDVRDENGKSLRRVAQGGLRPVRPPGSEINGEVLPGKSVEEATTVSDIFQFDQPGKFTIQVSHKEPGKPIVRSNIITVTVVHGAHLPKQD